MTPEQIIEHEAENCLSYKNLKALPDIRDWSDKVARAE